MGVPARLTRPVLGTPVDCIDFEGAVQQVLEWAAARSSRYVCLCNVHSTVTAAEDIGLRRALAHADLVLPDGAPVAWMLRRQGARGQSRVSGPDLMLACCELAARRSIPIYLYGATAPVLAELSRHLCKRWPSLVICGTHSPPFRPLGPHELATDARHINASGAGIVWVGLGCPKQEQWMCTQRNQVHAVMVGVGAAFDFHAEKVRRAPHWMRDAGLEWLHRLVSEPRRLGWRYLRTNTLFIAGIARQWLARRRG